MWTSAYHHSYPRYVLLFSLLLVAILSIPGASPTEAASQDTDSPGRWTIKLIAGAVIPAPGIEAGALAALEERAVAARAAGLQKIHALVQLYDIPTDSQKAELGKQGIDLQVYVPNNAWIAAIPAQDPGSILNIAEVRWIGDWSNRNKLHPDIKRDSWGEWAVHPTEDLVMVVVQLHSDIPLELGPELAKAHSGIPLPPISGIHGLTLWIAKQDLPALAAEEAVLWIEEGPAPLSPNNDGVRNSMQIDPLYSAPYNLNGSEVRVFVFDGGTVRTTHNTFNPGARVTMIDDAANIQDHPTHVAGTVAGDGDGGRAKGVAPAATILSAEYEQTGGTMLFWDNAGDIQADYANARNSYKADLGTNSIGSNTASNGYPCAREGDYGVSSNLLDGIVRGDNPTVGSPVLMTWANGNERTGGTVYPGRCGSNYLTTAPPSCAKNPIHVGAINSDYDSMTSFSSWGPCDDGRLKPVISASGCELGRASGESFIYSSLSASDLAYGGSGWCGTSMATPAVAGVVALMIQDWRAQGYGGAYERPLPALVKAMLIHTAEDLGQAGPDYIYGYGEVNAQRAIDLIRAGNSLGGAGPTNLGTGSIGQGQVDSFTVNVPAGTAIFKASLAWDDYAAAAFTSSAPVNNLDLEVVAPDGSTVYYPWILTPSAPYLPASSGVNSLDNQEQVVISSLAAGTWTVRVKGTSVPQAPQSYGLVYTTAQLTFDAGACTEQIINGGFESAGTWSLSGASLDTAQKHSGSYALRLGGAVNSSHTAYQPITIPDGVTRAELSFWWYMTTSEGSSGHPYDRFYAEVHNTSDAVLATLDYRSDGWQAGQWMKSENMDLTPWSGQTVWIYFFATNNATNATSFWVDDVSVNTCPPPGDFSVTATPEIRDVCRANNATYDVAVGQGGTFSDPVTLSATGIPGGTTESWSVNPVTPPGISVLTIGNTGAAPAGTYPINVVGTAPGPVTHSDAVSLRLFNPLLAGPGLSSPANGSIGGSITPTFAWNDLVDETAYAIEIATDPGFTAIVHSAALPADTINYSGATLSPDAVYYWRIRGSNACGSRDSATWVFRTTAAPICTELLLEPGFEGGPGSAWNESSSYMNNPIVTTDYHRTGLYSAWMGGLANETSQVWQVVTINPEATTVTLNYWYWISSSKSGCNANERAEVRIRGTPIASYELCASNNTSGFVQGDSVDLLNYSGATELRFWADTDNAAPHSSFLIDDVSIERCQNMPTTVADYSDLAGSYGIAWHTGDGTLRLGSLWTADTSFGAGSDNASDDGVSFPTGLAAGQPGTIRVNVQGAPTARWLRVWVDWNGDGIFGDEADGERVYNGTVVNGNNDISVAVPDGYSPPVSYRVRLFDSAAAPGAIKARDTGTFGEATGGEVEDGPTPGPTAVRLARFEAWPVGREIHLEWETATEIDNLGFNLYRSQVIGGAYDRLNEALIPSQGLGSSAGAVYKWTDSRILSGQMYYYMLEDVDIHGVATPHGPVQAAAPHTAYLPLVIK